MTGMGALNGRSYLVQSPPLSAWSIPQHHVREGCSQRQNRTKISIDGHTAARVRDLFLTLLAGEFMDNAGRRSADVIRLKKHAPAPDECGSVSRSVRCAR